MIVLASARREPRSVVVTRWAPAAVAAIAIVVYLGALANGFVLDDRGVILENPLVQDPASAWRAFGAPYWPAALGGGQYRPLGVLSFAADWAVSGGNPLWFHAVNVIWHAAAAALVTVLAAEFLVPAAAIAAGVLFAAHPVHVEAVANTVGRLECMMTAFTLAALIAHRRKSLFAPVFFAAALLSKESAAMFLPIAIAHDLLIDRQDGLRRARSLYLGYAAVAVAYTLALVAVFRGANLAVEAPALAGSSMVDRLLTAVSVIPHYARLLAAPIHLSADYAPQVIERATGITTGVLAGLIVLAATAYAIARTWRRTPVVAFAIAWIPLALAPVTNVFFATGTVLAERTLYLPSVGACLLGGWIVERGISWERHRTRVLAVAAFIALAFAARAWVRVPAWRDNRVYLLTLLADHPESYRAHFMAGRVHRAAGRTADAEREFALARALYSTDVALLRESASLARDLGHTEQAIALRDSATLVQTRRARFGATIRRHSPTSP